MRDKSVDRWKTYSEPGHMGICVCFKREFSPIFSKAFFFKSSLCLLGFIALISLTQIKTPSRYKITKLK